MKSNRNAIQWLPTPSVAHTHSQQAPGMFGMFAELRWMRSITLFAVLSGPVQSPVGVGPLHPLFTTVYRVKLVESEPIR